MSTFRQSCEGKTREEIEAFQKEGREKLAKAVKALEEAGREAVRIADAYGLEFSTGMDQDYLSQGAWTMDNSWGGDDINWDASSSYDDYVGWTNSSMGC